MARPKEVINAEVANNARIELGKIKNSRLALRLQTIVSCAEYPVSVVADVMGYSRQSVWKWIKQFKLYGKDGLMDKPKGHNPSKLSSTQQKKIARWLKNGKDAQGEQIHWTLEKLSVEIEKQFGIKLTKTPIWLMIRSMGFRQKTPRPFHAKADKKKQEDFKKNC